MRISALRKIVKHKAIIRDYVHTKIANLRNPNYDEYVKISSNLPSETFDYLQNVKPLVGKFLKKGNYEVTFEPVYKQPEKVSMNLYLKEHPFLKVLYNTFEMVHDKPLRLNDKDVFININQKGKNDTKTLFNSILDSINKVLSSYDLLLNKNLHKG